MYLAFFLDIPHILHVIAIALATFNLIAYLWLAFTVWLNGDRQSMIARVGVTGLGLAALFFFIHTLLIASPLSETSGIVNNGILWHLIWLPALGVPYFWFIIGLHYAALMNPRWHTRRPPLLIASAMLGLCVLLLLLLNKSTFTFNDTILLLGYSVVKEGDVSHILSPLFILPVLFLFYVAFCAIGPWFTPKRIARIVCVLWHTIWRRPRIQIVRRELTEAFWNDQVQIDQLDEPALSWHLARPGLLIAALLMLGLTLSLGILGVGAMIHWLDLFEHGITPQPPATLTILPLNLLLLDIYAMGSVALIVLLIGYSIVRHGILIERPLARRGFFEQWRGIVIVAATIAIFIASLASLTRSSLGGMLAITSIATGTYALFTWSSYTAHDRYTILLKPFLRSTNIRHWLNTDIHKTEQGMEALFFHLCQDVLEVQAALLVVLAGPVRRSFDYRWSLLKWPEDLIDQPLSITTPLPSENSSIYETANADHMQNIGNKELQNQKKRSYRLRMTLHGKAVICWVMPIYDDLGLVANLYLGPREDGGVLTDEDMELAQACGQRILDTLRDHEAMLTVASLLRRRVVDVKLMGAQTRRVLHDEILPMLHLALLRLETVRPAISPQSDGKAQNALTDAIGSISTAHRQLATMMRTMATSAPHQLERDGLIDAIRTMIVQDFQQSFDDVIWQVSDEAARCIDDVVPPAIAEIIFAAVQEILRNAARHARGNDVHRHLVLKLEAHCDPHVEIIITDDGVGIVSASSSTTGTGGGLITHSALLAIAGGSLTVKTTPGAGVEVHIFLPLHALHG